jgi:hypothetical protein
MISARYQQCQSADHVNLDWQFIVVELAMAVVHSVLLLLKTGTNFPNSAQLSDRSEILRYRLKTFQFDTFFNDIISSM